MMTGEQCSYDDTKVVHIGYNVLTSEQLRPNVKEGFILDEVLSFQIHVDNRNIQTPTM
jgi:hypothetical protein